jgi:phosphinothricin acetyltransferase
MNAPAGAGAFFFARVPRHLASTRPMPITIRPATAADVPAITAIYAHAVAHGTASFELDPPGEAEMLQRQKSLLDGGFPYLVAANGESIAGYAYAGLYRTRPAYRWTLEDSIYVDPNAQRRGVGRLLLERLIVESEQRGYRQMIAVIGDSTLQTPSIELHRALGFRMVGVLENVGYKFGRWLDSVLMQRELGPGVAARP